MVWGSSLGWLVFYSALAFGWKTEGFELLSCLSEKAEALQKDLQLEGKKD